MSDKSDQTSDEPTPGPSGMQNSELRATESSQRSVKRDSDELLITISTADCKFDMDPPKSQLDKTFIVPRNPKRVKSAEVVKPQPPGSAKPLVIHTPQVPFNQALFQGEIIDMQSVSSASDESTAALLVDEDPWNQGVEKGTLVGTKIPHPLLTKLLSSTYHVDPVNWLKALKSVFPEINFDAVQGKQPDEYTDTQNVEKEYYYVTMGANECFFYNEILEKDPGDAADLYRSGGCCILAQSDDYGLRREDDQRTDEDRLFGPMQAFYKDLYRLVNLQAQHRPLGTMASSHSELFHSVTAHADSQAQKLRPVSYLMPVTDQDQLDQLNTMIERYLDVAKILTKLAIIAKSQTPEASDAIVYTATKIKLEGVWPLFVSRYRQLVYSDAPAAVKLFDRAQFPDELTLEEANAGIVPMGVRPTQIFYKRPTGSTITDFTCPIARYMVQHQYAIYTQKKCHLPEEVTCSNTFCKFSMITLKRDDYYNLEEQHKVFAHYPLKQAKVDRMLKEGRLECNDNQEENIVYVNADLDDEDWMELNNNTQIVDEFYKYATCNVYLTPWTPNQLAKRLRPGQAPPPHGFTALTLGSLSGKQLVIQCNYPGEGMPLEREIPEEVIEMLKSDQVCKTGFGLPGESRLRSLGITMQNVVDLSNLVVLAFPQPNVDPTQMKNSFHHYMINVESPQVPFMQKSAKQGPSKKVDGVNLSVHPDVEDFSLPVKQWSNKSKLYLKVVHHGSLSIPVALAVKAVMQHDLGQDTNVLPYIHWINATVQGQIRFGAASRPAHMERAPFGKATVRQSNKKERSIALYHDQPLSLFVNSGRAVMQVVKSYKRKYPLDFSGIDPQFALLMKRVIDDPDVMTLDAVMRMLFKKSNSCIHCCPHCASPEHDQPTEECLEILQECMYPQCLEQGHNIGTCPYVMIRCATCGQLGHLPRHHNKPMPQLVMEFVIASMLHYQGYRIMQNVRIGLLENGYTPEGQLKYQVFVNQVTEGVAPAFNPVRPAKDVNLHLLAEQTTDQELN